MPATTAPRKPAKKPAKTAIKKPSGALRALKKMAKGGSEEKTASNFRKVDIASLLPLGCPIINLMFSGHAHGALPKGQMIRGYGDSGSGKSFLMCTVLAEASISSYYKDYRLIYDDAEGGAQFDTNMFGPEYQRRVEWECSETIEKCYCDIANAFEQGPCIYIVDSLDALTSKQEKAKFNEIRKASADKELKGEMTDGKAKANSKYLRQIRTAMGKHGSILILVSQVRDVMNSPIPGMKSTSGGKSVKFYAASEFQVSRRGTIVKPVGGIEREVGIQSELRIVKNRMYGTTGSIRMPILHQHGIDFTGATVDWLCEEKVLQSSTKEGDAQKGGKAKNPRITAPTLSKKPLSRELLIRRVESNPVLMERMTKMVTDRWAFIRAGIQTSTPRLSRYSTSAVTPTHSDEEEST